MKQILSLVIAWLVVELLPRTAEACAVCTAGREDETNQAFLISTVFLSLLPLAGLGTLLFVLWRRIQALESGRVPEPGPGRGGATGASAAGPGDAAQTGAPGVLSPPSPAH